MLIVSGIPYLRECWQSWNIDNTHRRSIFVKFSSMKRSRCVPTIDIFSFLSATAGYKSKLVHTEIPRMSKTSLSCATRRESTRYKKDSFEGWRRASKRISSSRSRISDFANRSIRICVASKQRQTEGVLSFLQCLRNNVSSAKEGNFFSQRVKKVKTKKKKKKKKKKENEKDTARHCMFKRLRNNISPPLYIRTKVEKASWQATCAVVVYSRVYVCLCVASVETYLVRGRHTQGRSLHRWPDPA